MSDSDRGAYAPPTDAPLSFDARQPVRGGGPAPLMLILSALVLIALVVAIVLFYRSGVREAGQPPRTVGVPIGEMKVAPPVEAQPTDPAAGLQIYQSKEEGIPTNPNFTAPPEEPQARAPVTVLAPPKPAPTTPVGPVVALPAAPAPGALKPAVAPPPVGKTAPAAPVVAKAAPPLPKAAPAATPAPKAGATGAAAVQIGAFSSQALADKGWNDAARIAPGGAAGKGKRVEAIQKNGATLYRTTVTGFASRDAASTFCNQLKAAGKSCFVK